MPHQIDFFFFCQNVPYFLTFVPKLVKHVEYAIKVKLQNFATEKRGAAVTATFGKGKTSCNSMIGVF